MRLMCPNCDAEYEVDASAIPESGRDVQCSNCGHAWFQHHPELEAEGDAESALYDPPPPLSKVAVAQPVLPSDLDWQVESDDPETILDAMGVEARATGANRPAPSLDDTLGDQTADPIPKQDIDPEVLRILREEAELETAQRALEQGRTNQDSNPSGAPVMARRVARLKGIQPPTANPEPVSASARLPKIETVSAALRNDDPLPAEVQPKRKTSRGGIFASFFIALAAAGTYAYSPDLAVLFPSFAKPLAQYVTVVDGVRGQLDILLAQAIALGERLIVLAKGWL